MKILSLDQALVTTGWAYFENDTLVENGTFSIKSTLPIEQRLGKIIQNLNQLEEKFESIDMLVFEDIQQQTNPQTYKKLAYCQAIILLWCYFKDIKYQIYSPSEWRSINGGGYGKKREEQKEAAINKVRQWYQINVNSDAADAINIGRAAIVNNKKQKSAF